MLREKRPCAVCGDDESRDLRDCDGCKESLCRYCASDHVCGEDGRSELVQLLEEHITDKRGAGGLVMFRVGGGITVAYIPNGRTISEAGAEALVYREVQRAKEFGNEAKNIAESLCRAPLGARGAICIAVSNGFSSLFAAKKADDTRITEQFRLLLEAERLANF